MAGISGVALAYATAGGIILWSGIKGETISDTVRSVLSGKPPAGGQQPITGSGTTVSTTQGGTNAPVANPGTYQKYAFSQFGKYGWGTDQQQPLVSLWNQESGWNPSAQNAGSGAAGIPQSIQGWSTYPGTHPGNWQAQIDWGLNYIKDRYGSPAAAWAHEMSTNPHWY